MHDNPAAATAPYFALPGHRIVALGGHDAVAFAQAQFMNDVAALASGHWQWNGWLTPKGRVIALFALLRIEDDLLWLLLPDTDAESFAAQLQRFVFRSKVEIAVRDDLHASGMFAAPREARGARMARDGETTLELDLGGEGGSRTLRIARAPQPDHDVDATASWARADLAHGLPRLPPAQAGQWTPQQLSLERLRAYSVRKGCYPGQEIVARTHFLGQAKRGLVLLELPEGAQAGAGIAQAGRALGSLACVAAGSPPIGLAVLPLVREEAPLQIDGMTVVARPLLDGIAR